VLQILNPIAMTKKITSLLSIFTLLLVFAAKAQPGTNPIFPYYQNFDSLIAGQTIEEQAGWYVDMIPQGIVNAVEVAATRGINGSQSMSINLSDIVPTDSTTSPLIGPLTANTTIGYSYRIVNSSGQAHTLTGNGGFKIMFKQSTSFQWILVDSISVSNHIDSTDYRRVELPIGSFNFMNGNFRFVYYQGFPGDDYFIDIDSLVIYDPTITAFNPTTINKSDVMISSNDLNQIIISNQSKLLNNNLINIYGVDGRLVYTENLINNIATIDASQWNKGIYLVQINNRSQKVLIR
jgi:hypothetical protein